MLKFFLPLVALLSFSSLVQASDLKIKFPGSEPSDECRGIYEEILAEAESNKFWYKHVEMVNSDIYKNKAICNMRLHGYDSNRGNRYTSRPIREEILLTGK